MASAEQQHQMDMRSALNMQILKMAPAPDSSAHHQHHHFGGSSQHSSSGSGGGADPHYLGGVSAAMDAPVKAHTPKKSGANQSVTEWNVGSGVADGADGGSGGGSLRQHWPSHLPRPPSRKKLGDDDEENAMKLKNAPGVIVYNANTQEGFSMARVLSQKGLRVIAVVRVVTSRNAKKLTKLKGVTVKVADLNDADGVKAAAEGCQQAFLVTKYWERFENVIEEQMAKVVLNASSRAGIKRLVLATFEDTLELRAKGRKSQIMPTADGTIYPSFEGMDSIDKMAKGLGIQLTHMLTSYLDEPEAKKSLILIRGENGKIITQPYIQENKVAL